MSPVLARNLHAGDTLHRNDWHMPIDAVDVDGNNVAVHVTAGFLLHYAADEQVDIDELPALGMVPPESSVLVGGGAAATSVAAAPLVERTQR